MRLPDLYKNILSDLFRDLKNEDLTKAIQTVEYTSNQLSDLGSRLLIVGEVSSGKVIILL